MDLREYLFRKRMKASAFAKQIDYNSHTIREYMSGRVRLSAKAARLIEKATNGEVTVEEILKNNPEKKDVY